MVPADGSRSWRLLAEVQPLHRELDALRTELAARRR
jgi:hypothetical protein